LAWNWHDTTLSLIYADGGLGDCQVFNVCADGEAWRGGQVGHCAVPGLAPCISFGSVRSTPHVDMLRLSQDLSRIRDLSRVRDLSRLRRQVHQTANSRSSALAIAGMMLLLAVCGWIVGGTEGARRALTAGAPQPNGPAISREAMFRWFGARLLRPSELPELFDILTDVCSRARLPRLPDLYCVPSRCDMNAYALGGRGGAAIILTDGLLRGMTRGEIAGLLAHEVAHICNNDAWAMSWAAALHRAIEWTSLTGLASLRAR